MNTPDKKRVWFYRRLLKPTSGTNGGNLKMRDSFDHIEHSDRYRPVIHFAPDTIWNNHPGNHWTELRERGLPAWEPTPGDLLFFAGTDWRVLSEAERQSPPVPVLNIVHPRHTRPEDPRHEFLQHPAIRIAKSELGADILRRHGINGPLFVIPDSIDLGQLPPVPDEKDIDLLIIGRKEPDLAKKIYRRLKRQQWFRRKKLNIQVQLPPPLPTRMDFLQLLARAKMALCIPLQESRGFEGFYLPALEAMALRTLVICPHAVGNVGHCIDHYNCLVPPFSKGGLLKGVRDMLALPDVQKEILLTNGLKTADKHRIEHERTAILDLVHRADELWKEAGFVR